VKGGLWLIRILLLAGVSLLVFSPLAVHGQADPPSPIRFDYDVSELMLPSSPVYPVVTTYREARMSFAERSSDKASVALVFANQDAAAIGQMVVRDEFVPAINHCNVFRQNFELCVGWMVIAKERGTDISAPLSRMKNDHLGQQAVLQEATAGMPEWAIEGMDTTRAHVAALLLEGIREIEGARASSLYASTLEATYPGLVDEAAAFSNSPMPEADIEPATDPVVITGTMPFGNASGEVSATTADSTPPPDIASISVDPRIVEPGESCQVDCSVIGSDPALECLWLCSGGNIEGDGNEAVWTAPDREGTYKIVITVTDLHGRNDSMAIDVRVREAEEESDDSVDESFEAQAPTPTAGSTEILGFEVTAEHKYLETSMVGYAILVSRSCTIQCQVEDPTAVWFEWTANGGELEADGDTATWTAPGAPANLEVTVTVHNDSGETSSEKILFHATTCSQCF